MTEIKLAHLDDVTVEYYVDGEGLPLVLLPSKGRSQSDFDEIVPSIASQGFKVIRPEYRGINNSTGPMTDVSLYDLAAEVSLVLDTENIKSSFIVGHAFGNWIARIVAVTRPDLVKGICVLAAAAKGEFLPEISQALAKSSDLTLPDDERVEFIKMAFFGPNGDATKWLSGWYQETKVLHTEATKLSPQDEWWDAGGQVPIFEVRAELDPFAPKERANEMRDLFGERVLTVEIPNASHSLIPEQPEAVVAALVTYGKWLFIK
ncbi:alpha/beta fold hydrolase [Fundicoccus culcitae]|uniref:Alpha/beta hydrolase n=1 Tax=Fundicoccus culcitae TaxID=2969821 RepID=A0ABY5P8L1_9LACT|nr:alpha/beta hydrolase [Fundicoccus culcitae]UUX35082.1 alpha/beta hydrolase [Fundicoccus culcitae]